ncbi:ABC transporter ATP-binding protein [Coprothermobacter platensis]|uniref:ABC transporter ATP-binding protein n=1 Tax=Coprothermobacter platensis TaxID=108819 RepID=UPI0003665E4F|nr:ABC transporter ATP-binding protein [Coprothermobacter platensis]
MESLRVENLKKYYGKTKAVDGVSFSLNDGEVVGLLGPNGAGKTTTLKCIAGLLRQTEGSITIKGMDHRDDIARSKLSYVPEVLDIYEGLTVWDHMKFIALAYELSDWETKAYSLLERFDLTEKRSELGLNLSKGMRQKVMICCGLMHDPDVLLFDEPLVGLDPRAVRELKDVFVTLKNAGKSLLISTHMLDTAQNFCDRVLVMKAGKLIAEGSVDDLRSKMRASQDSTLEDLFLEITSDEGK